MNVHTSTLKMASAPTMPSFTFGLSIRAHVFESLLRLSLFALSLDTILTHFLRTKQVRRDVEQLDWASFGQQ